MIQETFDCLLTRAFFINNEEDEILAAIDSKSSFAYLIKRVSNLMQQEDFFLLNIELQHKLSAVIRDYRFKYGDDSIIEDINYIFNENIDNTNWYPAKYDMKNMITVGNTDSDDERVPNSSYGQNNRKRQSVCQA